MTELNPVEWDQWLEKHDSPHLLQTSGWGELKSKFGWVAVRLANDAIGAQILFRKLPLGFSFGYIPKGPVNLGADEYQERRFWQEVDAACHKQRAAFLKVESDGWVGEENSTETLRQGFRMSNQHVQPHSTLVIDLQGCEDDVFNRMKPKTRYNIRLSGRKEVSVRASNDIGNFHALMSVTSRRETFHVHSLAYYQKAYEIFHPQGQCELFISEYQGQTLAALMVFACRKTGYYFYGASGDGERNRKPTYPLQWEAIRWAQRVGCKEYDMWGIPDDARETPDEEDAEREDGLWGVYRFKRGFGGVLKHALPAMDRIYLPALYKIYQWRYSASGTD